MSPRVSRLLQRRPLRRRVPPPLPLPLRPHLRLHSRRPLPLLQQLHHRPRPHSKETRPPQIPASPPTAADLWPLASDLRPLDGLWPLASGLSAINFCHGNQKFFRSVTAREPGTG